MNHTQQETSDKDLFESEAICRICGSKIRRKELSTLDKITAFLLGHNGQAIREVCCECGKEILTIEKP